MLDDIGPGEWEMGAAQRWWLHRSLESLAGDLQRLGLKLILRRGESVAALSKLANETGCVRIHCLDHHEPWWRAAETALAKRVELKIHSGTTLARVGSIKSGTGHAYRKFTPYWRALLAQMPPSQPEPPPEQVSGPAQWPQSDSLESWRLEPIKPNWAARFDTRWEPGEAGALKKLANFENMVTHYGERRDLPSEQATSRLSPHLHFGEISMATIWHRLAGRGGEPFLRELAWRDFSQEMMAEYPDIGFENGSRRFDRFPWRTGAGADADFRAWTRGRTGYPIVDAGMRELWATGWMHNRVRMIAASFLVKHLLIDWRKGARWFWDTLVDADYGNNSFNWQWVAGTGVDSSPFFRVMAPLLQSSKFDTGDYIRRWVPEIAGLSDKEIHEPEASLFISDYPNPVVGHREARERALRAWKACA